MDKKLLPAEVPVRQQFTPQQLYCLGWHFNIWYSAFRDGKTPMFAEPCITCKFSAECKGKWTQIIEPLRNTTGIQNFFGHSISDRA